MNKTAAEIAALVGGALEGDGAVILTGAAGLAEAGPQDISFLGNLKYAAAAGTTHAGCVFLPSSLPCPAAARILVEDPQYAFAQVLMCIEREIPKSATLIDSTAVIASGAVIGEETRIGPHCVIGRDVKIGRQCLLHPGVIIRENCVIGDRVILQPGAVIGADGFGFSTNRKTGQQRKIPQLGNVIVQDDVEIGANTTIDRATTGSTIIGAGTKIDNLVQIGHNVKIGRDCLVVAQVGIAGSTVIGDRVVVAGQAGIAGHLKIGDGAVITAQTGVMSDLEAGKIVFGSPAKPHREAFKLQALYARLPEIYEDIKLLKAKLR